MFNNLYLYNKILQQHDRELLQKAEQQRMLAELPRRQSSLKKYIAGRLAAFRVSLPFFTRQVKLCNQTSNLLLKEKLKKANATLYDGTHIPMKRTEEG